MNLNFKGLVTIKQVAERNGVSVATVRRWIKKGTLPTPRALVGNSLVWGEKQLNSAMVRMAALAQTQQPRK
ncbi:TPA: MerR family DNA-binding transcriptional regulator [Aeromonas hydrophila]|nr:MerR family DNA-binding transcriptional regulator [Aeromonas hydrophila]